ncbi:hypothetical protein LOK49_LG06G02227 [Camellia lanceoleosa]|uniref:Uncharacterized protein n=1 Tax=Camellia lanceoleosa TaxID=1840588 RepID=A0ACC0H871_9ERIC|nr:hypothetical protein LOK49_LG06G02227 [Camellia lanceoleosa]
MLRDGFRRIRRRVIARWSASMGVAVFMIGPRRSSSFSVGLVGFPLSRSGGGIGEARRFSSARRLAAMGVSLSVIEEVNQQGCWSNLVDGLALAVRPEVVEVEVVLDTVASADDDPEDDDPKENFYSGDGLPQPEEVSDWVLSRINEVSQLLGVLFEGHEAEALQLFRPLRSLGGGMFLTNQGWCQLLQM